VLEPDAPLVMVIQLCEALAVAEQPDAVVAVKLPVPPPLAIEADVGESV
jgi:hypothetical protein